MANFIDDSYFHTDLQIPQSANQYGTIDEYIAKFEKEVLIKLLGFELYSKVSKEENANVSPFKELINGSVYEVSYNGKTVKLNWPGLKNDSKVSLISNYIFCEYIRKTVSSLQQVGNMASKSEVSVLVSILPKINSAWCDFEEMYGYFGQNKLIPSAFNYLQAKASEAEFDSWIFTELKGSINGFDL